MKNNWKRSWLTSVILLTDIYAIISTHRAIFAVEKGSCCLLSVVLAYIPTYLFRKTKLNASCCFRCRDWSLEKERKSLFCGLELKKVLPPAGIILCLIRESAILETVITHYHQPKGLDQCVFNLLRKCSDSTQFSNGGIKPLYSSFVHTHNISAPCRYFLWPFRK